MALPIYASPLERIWHYTYLVLCTAIFIFLISPILVVIPLSFNAEPYFTFTDAMLRFDPVGYSIRWYDALLTLGMLAPDGLRDNQKLPKAIITPTSKAFDGGHDEPLSPAQILEQGLLTPGQWDQVSDEQKLLQNSGSNQIVGINDVTVYFATELRETSGNTLQGCAGHAPTRPAVMIAAHLDTVFPEGTPLKVRRDGTRLYAPGIGDDTRSLAVLLAYARAMKDKNVRPRTDILFVGNVGEEGLYENVSEYVRDLIRRGVSEYLIAPIASVDMPASACRSSISKTQASSRPEARIRSMPSNSI